MAFPSYRRRASTSYRRRSAKRVGFRRFSRAAPARAAMRGRVVAVRAMSNPVPSRLHNIVAPRFFTNIEYGFAGSLLALSRSLSLVNLPQLRLAQCM